MSKKPRKVEETKSPYPAKQTGEGRASAPDAGSGGTRYASDAAFRKAADKVFKVHHELLRKLAQ